MKKLVFLSLLVLSQFLLADNITPLDPNGIAALSKETNGKSQVQLNRSHGAARFVNIDPRQKGSLTALIGVKPADTVANFLGKHGSLFGLVNASQELQKIKETTDKLGFTQIQYQQVYSGIPVYGSTLISNVNNKGELRSVNGRIIPNISLSTTPALTGDVAKSLALQFAKNDPGEDDGLPEQDIKVLKADLVIYNPSINEDRPGNNYLAWKIRVNSSSMGEDLFIDAQRGILLNKVNLKMQALNRRMYDANQLDGNVFAIPKSYPNKPYWVEGNIFPTTDPFPLPSGWKGTNDALTAVKTIHDLYYNTFGIDSPNNAGGFMDTILNYTAIANAEAHLDLYPAMITTFSLDASTGDIVGHEWQHFYTGYSGTGLDYINQGGALHEAYSDIFGEVVEKLNVGGPFAGPDGPDILRHDGMCLSSSHLYPNRQLEFSIPNN